MIKDGRIDGHNIGYLMTLSKFFSVERYEKIITVGVFHTKNAKYDI